MTLFNLTTINKFLLINNNRTIKMIINKCIINNKMLYEIFNDIIRFIKNKFNKIYKCLSFHNN